MTCPYFTLAIRLQNDDESVLADILHKVIPSVWHIVYKPVEKDRDSIFEGVCMSLNEELAIDKEAKALLTESVEEELVAKSLARLWLLRKELDFDEYGLDAHLYRILRSEIRELLIGNGRAYYND